MIDKKKINEIDGNNIKDIIIGAYIVMHDTDIAMQIAGEWRESIEDFDRTAAIACDALTVER